MRFPACSQRFFRVLRFADRREGEALSDTYEGKYIQKVKMENRKFGLLLSTGCIMKYFTFSNNAKAVITKL